MLTLYGVVVGETKVIDVKVSGEDTISDVKDAVVKELLYCFLGGNPTLYHTRSGVLTDGQWLSERYSKRTFVTVRSRSTRRSHRW